MTETDRERDAPAPFDAAPELHPDPEVVDAP
jgi:hypothetical protein